jgi:hypothetical protein
MPFYGKEDTAESKLNKAPKEIERLRDHTFRMAKAAVTE